MQGVQLQLQPHAKLVSIQTESCPSVCSTQPANTHHLLRGTSRSLLRGTAWQHSTGPSWASNDDQLKDLSNTRALKHLAPLATDYWAASHSFVEPGHSCFVLVLVLHRCEVTVSSTGAENQFQGDDNGHVGRPCQVSPALPFPELL